MQPKKEKASFTTLAVERVSTVSTALRRARCIATSITMGISVLSENLLNGRDLAAARDAYQTRDADASKTAHTAGARAAGSRRHTLGSAHTAPAPPLRVWAPGGSGSGGLGLPCSEADPLGAQPHSLGCSD